VSRAERALELAARCAGTAAERPLRFAAELYCAEPSYGALTGKLTDDAGQVLAHAAGSSLDDLVTWWQGERDDFGARCALQPYARALIERGLTPDCVRLKGGCPKCGALPWVSTRSDAQPRVLCCSLCSSSWPATRVVCVNCSENEPSKLPHFTAAEHPGARIEACDSCKRYLKSLELQPGGFPEIDELTSLSLDVWAQEQGYVRLEPGLGGI
jgi:hypothetical protein